MAFRKQRRSRTDRDQIKTRLIFTRSALLDTVIDIPNEKNFRIVLVGPLLFLLYLFRSEKKKPQDTQLISKGSIDEQFL